jgi:hypothetical protein
MEVPLPYAFTCVMAARMSREMSSNPATTCGDKQVHTLASETHVKATMRHQTEACTEPRPTSSADGTNEMGGVRAWEGGLLADVPSGRAASGVTEGAPDPPTWAERPGE